MREPAATKSVSETFNLHTEEARTARPHTNVTAGTATINATAVRGLMMPHAAGGACVCA